MMTSSGRSDWPWEDVDPPITELTAAGGRCETWAYQIQRAIGGDVIRIVPDPAKFPGATFIGTVRNREGQPISNQFRDHYAVRLGGRVYDRITGPQGLSIDDYRSLFDWADDLMFDVFGP